MNKNTSFRNLRGVLLLAMICMGMTVMAQTTVTGNIVDVATGDPVIGASVLEMGTTNGTITDFDGNFSIRVSQGATLSISYMGYKTQEIAVGNQTVIKVRLGEDNELLDEVVVVGYGVVKKNDATGSVTAIKPDEMNKGLVTNAQDMMTGKIAGVNVTSSSGAPGAGATIRIRGGSSLSASNDPLIVIDGLAMDNNGIQGVSNPLSMVNPNDIETFTVLKDASATAIYGSRASNGVIIITTKKGAAGQKPKFNYEGNVSVSALTGRLETLTGDELRDYAKNILQHKQYKLDKMGDANTDWQAEIYRPAINTDHNFSMVGGTKNMPYRVSLGYTLQNGIIRTSSMQRVTAAVNLSPTFFDKHLTFNLNAKGMYIFNRYADGGVVGASLAMDPTFPVKDPSLATFDGYYQRTKKGEYTNDNTELWGLTTNAQSTANPVATLNQKNDRANSGSFVGNLEADYKIHGFEDLRLHANFGADYSYGKQLTSISPYSYSNHYWGWEGYTQQMKYNLQFNAYAQYYKDFSETQHFDAMVGYEWQHFYKEGDTDGWGTYPAGSYMMQPVIDPATGNAVPDPADPTKDLLEKVSLAGDMYNRYTNAWISENYLVSFFGRINWTGWNQVMLTATVRGDGSSRFAPNHRWGIFPSVALGWKIKETFLKDVNAVSDLKLRLGYGITGQQEIGQGDYPYLATYAISQAHAYYPVGDGNELRDSEGNIVRDADGNIMYVSNRPSAISADLTWEKTTTYNVGIDYGFLNSRITGSLDYYYRSTRDLINYIDAGAGQNFSNRVVSNIGSLRNQGVEFAINAVAIDNKSLKWDMGLNLAWNDNKITELTAGDSDDYYVATGGISSGTGNTIQAHKTGYAASSFYVYETAKSVDEQGRTVYQAVDRNKDGQIDAKDKYIYHDPAAKLTLGFQSKWQFYGFDLGITMRASFGNYVYNDVLASNLQWVEPYKVYQTQNGGYHGVLREAYDTYLYQGMHSDGIQALVWDETAGDYKVDGTFPDWYMLDYFVERASFLRIDNITLGYTFNKNPKINARIYATVQNPCIFSPYKGLDPEVFGGIDNNIYPRSMTALVGVSLHF